MLCGRQGHAAVVFRGSLYALGGFDGRKVLCSVERFDGDAWTEVPSLQCPRVSHSAAVYKDALYVIGGLATCHRPIEYDDSAPLSSLCSEPIADVEIFDGIEWRQAPKLLVPRAYHGTTVWDADLDATPKTRPSAPIQSGAPLKAGDKVKLTAEYASHGDASWGPLKPDDVGDLLSVSAICCCVSFNGRTWNYLHAALARAKVERDTGFFVPAGEGTAEAKDRVDDSDESLRWSPFHGREHSTADLLRSAECERGVSQAVATSNRRAFPAAIAPVHAPRHEILPLYQTRSVGELLGIDEPKLSPLIVTVESSPLCTTLAQGDSNSPGSDHHRKAGSKQMQAPSSENPPAHQARA
jgi:hypothetical protein